MSHEPGSVAQSYDRIAEAYAARFGAELDHKPLDRALLDFVAHERPDAGPVADVGCGPGHVAEHLRRLGVPVIGVDISEGMLTAGGRLYPEVTFKAGSLLALPADDGDWSAIVAFYSIIHLDDGQLPAAMHECARALCNGGVILLSFHVGDQVIHRDEMLGEPVSLDFHMLQSRTVVEACEDAGLQVEMTLQRRAHVAVEAPTTRGYVLARKGTRLSFEEARAAPGTPA